jgi:hypothetical protein
MSVRRHNRTSLLTPQSLLHLEKLTVQFSLWMGLGMARQESLSSKPLRRMTALVTGGQQCTSFFASVNAQLALSSCEGWRRSFWVIKQSASAKKVVGIMEHETNNFDLS